MGTQTTAEQYPFDTSGIAAGADGIRRYTDLPVNLVRVLLAQAATRAESTAIVELGGGELTYGQLWERAMRVAGGLRDAGVGTGDRVAVQLPNGVDWVLAFWGAQLAGAIVVPMNTRLAPAEADFILADCGAAHVVRPGEPLPDGEPGELPDPAHTDVAALFYTSGTTGRPKGAMTTHENFLSNIESVLRCRELSRDRAVRHATLISVPLFHVTGCNSQFLTQVALGGTSVLMPRFDATAFLAAIPEHGITLLTSVPTIYELVLRHSALATTDVSTVRTLSYGGAPIAPELVQRLGPAFPNARLGNGFGLSETSALATFLPHEYAGTHADAVGFPTPVNDVRLDRPDPVTGVGELLVRGPNVVAGYWGDPARTAGTFVDGWLHTGDLATITDGIVRIVDRAKDMINRGGENVYSVEVENALAEHPDVLEVAVVGVPDPVMGEKVGAVVLPRPGVTAEQLVPALCGFARERLADFKCPQFVRVIDGPLPRNAGGKVLKAPLRDAEGWVAVPR
ncbi:class I adenylate-forming enzyme family protein [Blastococcus xanthinilyticus]|uniref:Acyl-CoA synthetase (AMP-forming)/AMP-acid ligase II n=1 Tax=Blastococcus xanthinilyticus TaxID=1564164 RepID=A0A5S5D479_9ACTN|nr:AMP-binding protein [Blastococcus xanthinilyticus]TYP90827.1 acyl-CoA synthetase (AMP-forming)/AMP-acid ligase II [Blastococcus xanthinilyticus]